MYIDFRKILKMKKLLVLVTVIFSSTADIMGGHGIGKTFNHKVGIKKA